MSKSRLELHAILEEILGSHNVYFQPPEGYKLSYPCIVYERADMLPVNADNTKYLLHKRYTVTAIDEDPDSETPDKIIKLPLCNFDRAFKSGNMNHDVFDLYF